MTEAEVEAAKAALRTQYNAWDAARTAAITTVKVSRETQIKNAIADLDLALANWGTLTNAQVKEVTRTLAIIIRALLKDELR